MWQWLKKAGILLRAEAGGRRIERTLSIESPLFVIDNNVSGHFVVLYRALRAPGGAHPIEGMALGPQPMLTVPLRAESSGPAALLDKTTGERIDVESFRVQLGDLVLTLYGRGGDLLAIDNSAQKVFLYRSDLLPEGAEIALASKAAETGKHEPPPSGLRGIELSFESDGLTLVGTLTLPEDGEGPFPAVLMIHGSGALDRDESAPGFPLNFFKEVAQELAQEGIASFRYDKRGVGKSEGDLSRAGMRDLLNDARAALELLQSREEVDPRRVFVLGHSEGGVLAPLLASEGGVAGVILVAAPARPLDAVLLEQARRIAEAMGLPPEQVEAQVQQTQWFIEFVKATEGEEALSSKELKERFPWLTQEMLEAYQSLSLKWFREHVRHDPLQAVRFVRVPVLILHGEKDLQVAPYHAERLAEALRGAGNEDVTLKILPDLNHLMRRHPEAPNIAYRHLDEPVDGRVLRLIAEWVKEHLDSSTR